MWARRMRSLRRRGALPSTPRAPWNRFPVEKQNRRTAQQYAFTHYPISNILTAITAGVRFQSGLTRADLLFKEGTVIAGRRLLVADDSLTIQKVVDLTFSDEGMEVRTVSDGDQSIN